MPETAWWYVSFALITIGLLLGSLWLLWQIYKKNISLEQSESDLKVSSSEIRSALSKLMVQTQRSNSLLENSSKDVAAQVSATISQSLELFATATTAATNDSLGTIASEISNNNIQLNSKIEAQLRDLQTSLSGTLSEFLRLAEQKLGLAETIAEANDALPMVVQLEEALSRVVDAHFVRHFEQLQVALPDIMREDFTGIFGTELDLIQKQIDSALESISSSVQSSEFGAGAEGGLAVQGELREMLSSIQESVEAIRQLDADTHNRNSEMLFAVREIIEKFAAIEAFMQEVTDIPRLTEQSVKKRIGELESRLEERLQQVPPAQLIAPTFTAEIQTAIPEIVSTETAKVTRKLAAAHSSNEDISKLQGAFESLLERRKRKEELQKAMVELQSASKSVLSSEITESEEIVPTKKTANASASLANDLQRLQDKLAKYEESKSSALSVSDKPREASMLETIASESIEKIEIDEKAKTNPHLLIVDDSVTNLSMLKNILNKENFELTLVTTGNAALDVIAENPPDVVLLDIVLPDIDGYEVCKEIKSVPEIAQIPVIFMSGMNETAAIVKGFEVGGADYIIKPFQKEEIIARLKSHYDLSTIRQSQHKYISQIQHEREKSDQLLKSILPEAIADRLKKGEGSIADGLPNVSVMFADIVGFTKLSAKTSPQELVEMLNVVFSAFDTLTEHHGLEKIKTIGDAYMVAGGLLNSRPDHLESIARLGLEMTEEIKRCADFLGVELNIRIGIHCGEATAGVIGQNKFAYDLWGDSVNTASRMESHGEPGKVHCSESVFQSLQGKFAFSERGEMEIKGKGLMKTYFIVGEN